MSNVVVVHIVLRVSACYVARFETFGMKVIAVVVGSVVQVNVCMDTTVFKSVSIMKHACTPEFLEWQTRRYAELCALLPGIPLTALPVWTTVAGLRQECIIERCV